ncbi:glycosyltransferase [Leptolyngbya sp. FACHB-36]|uniref:glycosyltransferase n=1 Tax=Leptolyngbya sp. FACHB-36 TaxID=2692808 RepID=UPI00167FF906|nr:glycosyltransferase [Leptolyngbya sp. FACHB-36]MBD2022173.1 glycosyltransferase [Leptolyngbya sp. FACHB-36]
MKIAYLVNQYPKVSHSFIRREILELEACGVEVLRFAMRSCRQELVDEADKLELQKTRLVLDSGIVRILAEAVRVAVTKPFRFVKALALVGKLSKRSKWSVVKHLAYLAEACVLLRWFAETSIQHVHVHFGTNSTTVALLCEALGGPQYSFTVHGPEEFDWVDAIALPEKIKRATFVVAVSSFGKSQLYRWCSLQHWSNIHVVHCGVDDSFFRQSISPIPPTPQLVSIGRLCEQKGQLLLMEAAAQLVAEGVLFKLVLVGDGPLRSEIEALIAEKRLQHCVEVTGWASNDAVRQHLLESRAMVLPSFAEGLPVVIMEALALNRPVITTYVAGIPELVEPDQCGWLIPAGSVEALVEAMRSAVQAPVETLEKMGNLGSKRVFAQHNAGVEAGKLAALFRSYVDS